MGIRKKIICLFAVDAERNLNNDLKSSISLGNSDINQSITNLSNTVTLT